MKLKSVKTLVAAGVLTIVGVGIAAQQDHLGYQDTPMLPGGKWHVHDGTRPQPKVIDPGTNSTPRTPGRAPSDAIVLFNGKDLSRWKSDKGGDAKWKIDHGALVETPGAGYLLTRDEFQDCQLHIEWASPKVIKGSSQGRGNSGVLFYGVYEVQVLDSYNNPTYPDGQAAALYGQHPPLVNASRKPGEWQSYDILFTAPRFKDGKLETPGYATVLHNGVAVHNHTEIWGQMQHKQYPKYTPHAAKGSIALQDHGNPVRFRNIWIRELKDYD
jgi:hypothetical protein